MSPRKPFRLSKRMRRACVGATALLVAAGGGVGVAVCGATASPASHPRVSAATDRQERVLDAAYKRIVAHPQYADGEGRLVVDYGIGKLWSEGVDGAGTTVAVVGQWDSPLVATVLKHVDAQYGLPAPQVKTIYPSGKHRLPARCPSGMVKLGSYGSCEAWEGELALDVTSVHMMAPYAKIIISATPSDSETTEDAAEQGSAPEIMQGVETIARRHLAKVISSSTDSAESGYRYGRNEVTAQDPGLLAAAAAGIPFVNLTGDCGAAQDLVTTHAQCAQITRHRAIGAWDDSPWTLAVGGSIPQGSTAKAGSSQILKAHGYPLAPNAGLSTIYSRPSYQNGVASSTHSAMRSVPDITMDNGSGTSESAPLMAGVLALATQANGGHDLGPVNTALYEVLGPKGAADGISDVTHGNNSVTSTSKDGHFHVPGFSAQKGFDVASGWGTIYAPRFVPALAKATQASHDESAARAQAAAQLTALRHAMTVSGNQVSATGFLPGFPVRLSIDGRHVATLRADAQGDIHHTIDPAALHLSAGSHAVTLSSMLIMITGRMTMQ